MSSRATNLAQSALSALKWNYAGVFVRTVSAFVIGIVLARALGPGPFGQVAVASLVIGFGSLVADLGLGPALIQKREITPEDIRLTFTLQSVFATILLVAGWWLAPLLGLFFHQPAVIPVVRALLLMFIFQAFGQTATSLLKRDLRLRDIQAAQIGSYLFGYLLLGLPLAFYGYGVWSLVAAQLAQSLTYSLLVYARVHHSLVPRLGRHPAMLGYGRKAVTCNVASWAIGNLDNAFVARAFGVVDLGLYNRAYMLMNAPTSFLTSGLQGVLLPAYARRQDKPDVLRRGYLGSMAVTAMLTMTPFAVVAAIAPTFITALYGQKWAGAAQVMAPLALAMPFDALMALGSPILWSTDRVEREARVQVGTAAVFVIALAAASRLSLAAVGWGVLAVYVFRALLLTRAVVSTLHLRWDDIFRAVRGAVLVAAGTAACVRLTEMLALQHGLQLHLRLAVDLVVAASIAGVLLLASAGLWTDDSRWVFGNLRLSFPALARPLTLLTGGAGSVDRAAMARREPS